MDSSLSQVVTAGAAVVVAGFTGGILQFIKKQWKANGAEAAVYTLLTNEVSRLAEALKRAHDALDELRSNMQAEQAKCDAQLHHLQTEVNRLSHLVEDDRR